MINGRSAWGAFCDTTQKLSQRDEAGFHANDSQYCVSLYRTYMYIDIISNRKILLEKWT
jgi:hypothetical protein